jgi:hypothetical protein
MPPALPPDAVGVILAFAPRMSQRHGIDEALDALLS